jgi:hypothetical protein
MDNRWLRAGLLWLSLLSLIPGATVRAEETFDAFIEGLRSRGFHDMAITYLEIVESSPATTAEVRKRIPFERGVTLLEGARLLRNADAQARQLDEAQAQFERFTRETPDHPLAGQASTQRARILLNKARVETWQAEAPANEGNQEAFRQRARQLIRQAREVFQEAERKHQKEWEQLKGFIPEEELQRRQARDAAESLYMQAQLDVARCTYEEAQATPRESKERNELLNRAAGEFELIYQKYRQQIAGLHARMWQAKCFEEQDDIRKAVGLYNEILDHPGASLQELQDRVRWFRLICLNHEQRKDYQLVVEEATTWRNASNDRLRSEVGLGIQFELARAQEALAATRDQKDAVRASLLSQALTNARTVNRYPGPLKAPSAALIQRLLVALNRDDGDPRDFDSAFGKANQLLEEVKLLNGQIDAATAKGDTKRVRELQETLTANAAELTRLYDLALRLADARTDAEQANICRFRLAYGYYLQERYLEAGVVADYVARKHTQQFPEVAVESAYVALAAFDREYQQAPAAAREFEKQQVFDIARFVIDTWPESDRAVDARMAVARLFRLNDEPDQAAEWYAQVPATSRQYAEAQLSAGQSFWNAYLTRAARPLEERPAPDQLAQWKDRAEEFLQRGVARRAQQVPAEQPPPDELVLGKLSLVQIRNSNGVYRTQGDTPGAIELLTEDPHPVLEAVMIAEGENRPTTAGAVKSRAIATLAYQQLLRAYIGVRDLEAARATREDLEAIAGTDDAGALTQVYVDFGRELQKELDQLKAADDRSRLDEVRAAFEAFLGDLFTRQDGQTFNSRLWIAETYTGLAEGTSDDSARAQAYFAKAAATYQSILEQAAASPEFLPSSGQITGVRLRLVNCQRSQGDFSSAEATLLDVLKERPNAIDAQIEAARLYEAWAESGSGPREQLLQYALNGRREPAEVWGWGLVAQKLQRFLEFGQAQDSYEARHIDARYHLARCQLLLAEQQTSNEAMTDLLEAARLSIQRFVSITETLPNAEWQRFDALYQQTFTAAGLPARPLARQRVVEAATARPDTATISAATPSLSPARGGESAGPSRGRSVLVVSLLVATLAGLAGAIYFLTVQQDRKRRAKYASAGSTSSPRTRRSRH